MLKPTRWRARSWRSKKSAALAHERELEPGKLSYVDRGVQFCRDLRAKGNSTTGKQADKAFRDSLYEDA